MVVWMNCGEARIGVDDGIVPRAMFERLKSLEFACEEIIATQSELLTQARAQAGRLVEAARVQARQIHDAGLRAALASARRGFEDARVEGMKQWHDEQTQRRAERALSHAQVRDQLASMVVDATRQLVVRDGLESYFRNALIVLDRLAEQQRALTLTVHPTDRPAAVAALAALQPRWPQGTTVQVAQDAQLAPGSAVCESSEAWVDASLEQNIRALHLAVERALASKQAPIKQDIEVDEAS